MPEISFEGIPNKIGGTKILNFYSAIRDAVVAIKALETSRESISLGSTFKQAKSRKGISIKVKIISKPDVNEGVKISLEREIRKVINLFFPAEEIIHYQLTEH